MNSVPYAGAGGTVPPRVLVAEDSATVRAIVRSHLERDGLEVLEADDGLSALERVVEVVPDVVLLDVEMPGLDGHGVLAAMRADERLRDIPVVFLTARDHATDVVAGLDAGAHDYLRKPFDEGELRARIGVAVRLKQASDALRRHRDELERVSRTDALTGLANRRHLDEHLRAHASAARRHRTPLALLLIDIDHFKQVNDSYGHLTGDTVLSAVAGELEASLRVEDVVGRWGGEEFLVVLPNTDLDGAWLLGERIRRRIEDLVVAGGERGAIVVTVSIGCAAGVGDEPDDLLRRADRGLYEAKDGGRNQVRTAV